MSKPLDLTQRQVQALCEGAKRAGFTPVIRVGKLLVHLIPEEHGIPAQDGRPIEESGKGYL